MSAVPRRAPSISNAASQTLNDVGTVRPDSIRPHEVFPLMRSVHMTLRGYKKSSEKLLELCQPYYVWFFHLRLSTALGPTPRRLPKRLARLYERAEHHRMKDLEWHKDFLQRLQEWSSWDTVAFLARRHRVKDELEKTLRSAPVDVMFLFLITRAQRYALPGPPTTMTVAEAGEALKESIWTRIFHLYAEETVQAIESVLSSKEEMNVVMCLRGPDAQSFLDLLDETVDCIDSKRHHQCMHALRKLCGRSSMLPSSCVLHNTDLQKIGHEPIAKGGFADVWLGTYQGRRVALKVIRLYARSDVTKIKKRFYREAVLWKRLSHKNIVPFIGVPTADLHLCIACEWMDNDTIMEYLKKNPKVNRLRLLVDVSRGLQYLHSIGIVHGDLKGANILIDNSLHARLTDFGLTALIYKASSIDGITPSSDGHGSTRWMAPELLSPEEAGLPTSELSTASDIYALGMVMLEVFTGHVPFYELNYDGTVILKVIFGVRPERPVSATALGLSDDVWRMMEACWHADRIERPTVLSVLQCMEHGVYQFLPQVRDELLHPFEMAWGNIDVNLSIDN